MCIRDRLKTMGINALISVDFDEEDNNMFIKLDLDNMGILIGKHGQTLDSLQYLSLIHI